RRGLPLTPAELTAQHVEERAVRRLDQGYGDSRALDADRIPVPEGLPFLAVEGENNVFIGGAQDDLDVGMIRKNDGPVSQGMGANRRQHYHPDGRVDDRPARGEGVGG